MSRRNDEDDSTSTCTDDNAEWVAQCCLCGSSSDTKHCPLCGHTFCDECRVHYFRRGLEAVKVLVGRSSLYCGGGRHG